MAKLETESVETLPTTPDAAVPAVAVTSRAVELFVGIAGSVDAEMLRASATAFETAAFLQSTHLTLVYPGAETTRTAVSDRVELASFPLSTGEGAATPWAQAAASQAALLAIAAESQAQTIALLHPDLAALTPEVLERMASPVITRTAELVIASYSQGPFDGLVNTGILAPLTRALYGKRIQFPLAADFVVSPRMAARLVASAHGAQPVTALWPGTVAAGIDAQVVEVPLSLHHPVPAGDFELGTVITQLVGSVFAEMESHAPLWQRVRGSQPAGSVRNAPLADRFAQAAAAEIDTEPMVNSFLLGSRSLQDVWGLILPPVTLLDLKRLTRLAPGAFRMPDDLWVRIVYDFALGYRLRIMNRTHLLGALTPLYLGWVASYVQQAAAEPAFDGTAYAERLARAFEDGKPYLVRRWRWPDRFNP